MNRLSELQTIVKVSKACNSKGLIKEADQLLNIFTKLAQETPENADNTEPAVEPETNKPEIKSEKTLNDQLIDYQVSFDQIMQDLNGSATFEESKNTLPELNKIIDLARVILDNPNLYPEDKKILTDSFPQLIILQETLNK